MHKRSIAILILLFAALLLSACGGIEPAMNKPREKWRGNAEAACIRSGAVSLSPHVRRASALNGPGPCGTRKPFVVTAALNGQVEMSPPAKLTCRMVPAIDDWLRTDVQPSAHAYFGEKVTGVEVAASYGCRTRNSKRGGKMSEHGFANAIDIRAFVLEGGRRIDVESGWHGAPTDALFLRSAHQGACKRFKTVIGPDGDRHHRDHFHFDLAWHGKDGSYVHCE